MASVIGDDDGDHPYGRIARGCDAVLRPITGNDDIARLYFSIHAIVTNDSVSFQDDIILGFARMFVFANACPGGNHNFRHKPAVSLPGIAAKHRHRAFAAAAPHMGAFFDLHVFAFDYHATKSNESGIVSPVWHHASARLRGGAGAATLPEYIASSCGLT